MARTPKSADYPTSFRRNETDLLPICSDWKVVAKSAFLINYFDSFDGAHPRVFVPTEKSHGPTTTCSSTSNYRQDQEGGPRPRNHFSSCSTKRPRKSAGISASTSPYRRLRCAKGSIPRSNSPSWRAPPKSVLPNVLGKPTVLPSQRKATGAKLGNDLVVQTPYGDSGRTTFFHQVRSRLE